MIRILLVEDKHMVREGLATLLNLVSDFDIVGESENGLKALEIMEQLDPQPDVILMDIIMPVMDGLEATQKIKQKYPESKVVILTTFSDFEYAREAVRAGAISYVLKASGSAELESAIRNACKGVSQCPHEIFDNFFPDDSPPGHPGIPLPVSIDPSEAASVKKLSATHKNILKHLSTGANYQEIASILHVTDGTVRNHLTSISRILGFERVDRTKLTLKAIAWLNADLLAD